MSKGQTIVGEGSQKVELATGALVWVTGRVSVLANGVPQSRCYFRLNEDQDTVEIIADKLVKWSIRWLVPKPGYEMPDPTPIALPVGAFHPEPIEQTIARMVRHQVNQIAKAEGFDAEDEDDYEDDEDFDEKPSPYEFEEIAKRTEQDIAKRKALDAFIARKRAIRGAAQARKGAQPPAEPAAPQAASPAQPAGAASPK